ncbi:MAG TPA: RNA-binding domain-containing protein [Polyangiaceae bacterium]|nr:RNA-binding domain-containing protein [Polyangiaceae bacterium]
MTSLDDLNRWLTAPREDEHLEFKAAVTTFDQEKALKYFVALANEGGGKLVLGVSDRAPRVVVGSAAFRDSQQVRTVALQKLRLRVDVEELAHPDGRVVVFHVPGRSLGAPIALDGAYWMRSGEQLVAMTNDRLRGIFDEGKPEWALRAAKMASSDEVVALLDTQGYFDLLELPYPTTREAVLERFADEQLIVRAGGGWAITNLGAILFAKKLEQFDLLDERIRAAYQHCCLRYVMNQHMTNQSLRERFKLPESKSETISRLIRDAVEAGRVKGEDPSSKSKKYAKYVPFWA